jgi:hypothetical protein
VRAFSVAIVTVYLLESYMPGSSEADLVALVERLSDAAQALLQDGLPVRYLRSTYVPEDETCFHYVEASAASAAERLAERAELSFDRILEARSPAVSTASDLKEGQ